MSLLRGLFELPFRCCYGRPLRDEVPLLATAEAGTEESANPPRCAGLILTAGGVGGFNLCGTALRYVLGAGAPYAFHSFPWSHGLGRWFADLTDVANRDARADLLAETVRRFQGQGQRVVAGVPVFLVGKSGGCGIVVKTLERLDENSVERAILLAPALSPDYDLTRALSAVRGEMVVFWSPLDVFFLGLGTHVFGTVDRVRTSSAGLMGFRVPTPPAEPERIRQYGKLRQVGWSPRMAAAGHLGGHFGVDSPVFLKSYVVPLLRREPPRPC